MADHRPWRKTPNRRQLLRPFTKAHFRPSRSGRFDYSDLDHWMVQADRAIQRTRRALDQFANFRAADANGLLDVDR